MFGWFRKRTRLEQLQRRYAALMKYSFEKAVTHRKKSELARKEARAIYKEICTLRFKADSN